MSCHVMSCHVVLCSIVVWLSCLVWFMFDVVLCFYGCCIDVKKMTCGFVLYFAFVRVRKVRKEERKIFN